MSHTRRISVLVGQELHVVGDLIYKDARGRAHSGFRQGDESCNALTPIHVQISAKIHGMALWFFTVSSF